MQKYFSPHLINSQMCTNIHLGHITCHNIFPHKSLTAKHATDIFVLGHTTCHTISLCSSLTTACSTCLSSLSPATDPTILYRMLSTLLSAHGGEWALFIIHALKTSRWACALRINELSQNEYLWFNY